MLTDLQNGSMMRGQLTKEEIMTKNGNRPLVPYARQSRKKEHSISIGDQVEAMQKWAKTAGVKLAAPVIEEGVSGSKSWRDRELGRAISACENGDASGIIVAWQDRLSRESGLGTAEVWAALDAAGARLVIVNEGLDTATGDHEMLFTIKSAIAREQWKRYRDNWENARRSTVETGVMPGPAPLGYSAPVIGTSIKGLPIHGPLTPNDYAPLVVEAFVRRARGASLADIARHITASGAKTAHGNEWSRASARHVLENRVYLGELKHGEFENKAAHPALVTPAQYRAANRKKGKRLSGERGDGRLLGNGLCRCGTCGQCLCYGQTTAKRADGTSKKYEFLRCINPNCTKGATISIDKIEPYLLAAAFERLPSLWTPSIHDAEMKDLESRAEALAFEVETIHAQVASGEVSPSVAAPLLTGLEREAEQVDSELASIGNGNGVWRDLPASVVWDSLFEEIEEGHDALYEKPPRLVARHVPTARGFLKDILGPVVITPGKAPVEERVTIEGGSLAGEVA